MNAPFRSRFVETVRRTIPLYDTHGPPGYWEDEPSEVLQTEYARLHERLLRTPLETMEEMVAFKKAHADEFPKLVTPQSPYPNFVEVFLTPTRPMTGLYGVSNLHCEGNPANVSTMYLEYVRGTVMPAFPLAASSPRGWGEFPSYLTTAIFPTRSLGVESRRYGDTASLPITCSGSLCLTIQPYGRTLPPGTTVTLSYDIYEIEADTIPSSFTLSYPVSVNVRTYLTFPYTTSPSSNPVLRTVYSGTTALRVILGSPHTIEIGGRPIPLKRLTNGRYQYELSVTPSTEIAKQDIPIHMTPLSSDMDPPIQGIDWIYYIVQDIQNTVTFTKDGAPESATYWL